MIRLGATLPTSPPLEIDSVPNLLLDDYTGGVRAYSLRKLKKGYGGYSLRLRRSGDNEEVDVAFDDDDEFSADSKLYNASGSTADGTLLSAWIGFNGLYVAKFYDQSGGGFDMAQSTALLQPTIGAFGSFNTSNGKITPYWNGTTALPLDSTGLNIGSLSTYIVSENLNHTYQTYQWPWGLSTDAVNYFGSLLDAGNNRFYYGAQYNISQIASTEDTQQIKTFHAGTSAAPTMYQNGTVASTVGTREDRAVTTTDNNIGAYNAAASLYGWQGYMQEFIAFDADTISDRVAITSNINDHYGTY